MTKSIPTTLQLHSGGNMYLNFRAFDFLPAFGLAVTSALAPTRARPKWPTPMRRLLGYFGKYPSVLCENMSSVQHWSTVDVSEYELFLSENRRVVYTPFSLNHSGVLWLVKARERHCFSEDKHEIVLLIACTTHVRSHSIIQLEWGASKKSSGLPVKHVTNK
jgi:hypothetical protein